MDRRAPELLTDGAIAVFAFVATSLGFASWYSRVTFDPQVFHDQYHDGIYRYRVLGRDLVWWVYQHVVSTNVLTGPSELDDPGRMYPAYLLVIGAAFVAFVVALGVLVHRSGLPEPGRTLVVWTLAGIAAFSSYVVTPYDNLSYLLLVVFVLLALARRRDAVWLALAVAAVGVLNRETMLLGVAVLVAILVARPQDHRLRLVTIGSAAVMAGTYALLRLANAGGGPAMWDTVLVDRQLSSQRTWVGVGLVVLTYAIWIRVCRLTGLRLTDGRPLAVFYLVASPYIAVCVLTGQWFELRLVIPLLIGDLAVRGALHASRPAGADAEPELATVV